MADGDNKMGAEQKEVQQPSRRKFLVQAGYAIGGVIVGGTVASLIRRPAKNAEPAPDTPTPATGNEPRNFNRALMFFNQPQFAIVSAATERIFPADDAGPGALALGVPFFIDHQLAGEWGYNAREYMMPPFFTGEKVQGYQGRLKRRELFEIGLREMENYSQTVHGKAFAELAPEQQDGVLKAFESDEVKLTTISPSGFFTLLRSSTLEGAYSDPLYGGNLDMNGWRMRNYPGNQMSYASVIDKDFAQIEPSSLQDHLSAH